MIPNMFEKEKQAVAEDLKEKSVAIIVDETTDAQDRSIMNTLLEPLTPHAKPVVVSVDFMNNVSLHEVAQKIERILREYKVEFHQVRALISDNAPYMNVCFKALSPLYEKKYHTCNLLGTYNQFAGSIFMQPDVTVFQFATNSRHLQFIFAPNSRHLQLYLHPIREIFNFICIRSNYICNNINPYR